MPQHESSSSAAKEFASRALMSRALLHVAGSTRFRTTRHHGHRPGSADPTRNATGQESFPSPFGSRQCSWRRRPLPYTDKGASMSGREPLALIRRPIANRGGTGCRLHCAQRAISRNRYRGIILLQLNTYHHPISDTKLRCLTGEFRVAEVVPAWPTIPWTRIRHRGSFFSSDARGSATGSGELASDPSRASAAFAGLFKIPPRYAPVMFSRE